MDPMQPSYTSSTKPYTPNLHQQVEMKSVDLPHDLNFAIKKSAERRNLHAFAIIQDADRFLESAFITYQKYLLARQAYNIKTPKRRWGEQQPKSAALLEKPEQKSDELVAYERAEAELKKVEQEFKEKHIEFSFNRNTSYEESIVTFFVDKERALNKLFNWALYEQEVTNFFNQNKETIFKSFPCLQDHNWSEYIISSITPMSRSGETHNKGRKPVCLELINSAQNKIRLVCKPRSAELDRNIIELFGKINSVSTDGIVLPTYSIYSGDNFSIWEYVEGANLKKLRCPNHTAPYHFIEQLSTRSDQNPLFLPIDNVTQLLATIKKMTRILSLLNISDLHRENMILKGCILTKLPKKESTPKTVLKKKAETKTEINLSLIDIVPIDLEVVHRGYVTLLMEDKKIISEADKKRIKDLELTCCQLNPHELKLINELEMGITKTLSRVLPLATDAMSGLVSNYQGCESLTKSIQRAFEERGYQQIDPDVLKIFILGDLLNSDVPLFTEKDNILYHGSHPLKQNQIGIKKP